MKVSKDEFVSVLVDCKGYAVDEAMSIAREYRNDIGSWIKDIGGDEESINQAMAYLGK